MVKIWRAATEQFQRGEDFVLAVILAVRGSSPRHVGTRFLVRADGSIVGTIGGGTFEAQVHELAVKALDKKTSLRVLFNFTGADAQSPEMICGGDAEVLVEYVNAGDKDQAVFFAHLSAIAQQRIPGYFFTEMSMQAGGEGQVRHLLLDDTGARWGSLDRETSTLAAVPERRSLRPAQLLPMPGNEGAVFLEWIHSTGTVFIFGAGHVGRCVAHLAAYVDFKVVVIDDRAEFLSPEEMPDADQLMTVDAFDDVEKNLEIASDSYLVIVTRGHLHDKTVLQQAIRHDVAYLGMIGSRRKTNLIFQGLLQEGATREQLEKVHSPIGLPIGGETPQEIAVSIVAEMIQVRDKKVRLSKIGACPEAV
jgi:xanthine dehydrogenase accessory factor